MNAKRKNIVVRLLIRLTGMMLTLGIIFGLLTKEEVGVEAAEKKTETEQQVSKPTKKEVRALVKKISKANNVERLIKKHKSICRINSDSITWFSKEASYTRTDMFTSARYADNNGAYYIDWAKNIFKYIYLLGEDTDKYEYTDVRYFFDFSFSKGSLLEDETVSIEYTEESIILTRVLNENSKKDFLESWDMQDIADPIYDVLVVDRNTYEVKSTDIYSKGKDGIVDFGEGFYLYDVEEPAESHILRMMGERQEGKMVSYTIIRDAGTEKEIRVEKLIPAGSKIGIDAPGTKPIRYADPECTELYGEWDGLKDTVVYIKTAED